jgi:predicted dehydrogenase
VPRRSADLSGSLRVLVIGCGVMGERHARVIAAAGRCELLTLDVHADRAQRVAERHGGQAVRDVPSSVDVVVVATPTATHRSVAEGPLGRGAWCLVEKPLADTLEGARALAAAPRCLGALSERYNRAVRAAGELQATEVEGRRVAPATGRGLDTDVVCDLMLHDLDLVLDWAGSAPVRSIEASGGGEHGRIDSASAHLTFDGGIRVTLVASRVAPRPARWIRVCGGGEVTALDLLAGRAWRGASELPADARDALTCQWEQVVAAVHGRASAREPGLRALELALRIRDEIVGRVR